jgi:hypothetical protein
VICRVLPLLVLFIVGSSFVHAQENVPILSGGAGFLGATKGGANSFQPVIAPVLAIPLGEKWLIESRADLRGFVSRESGTTGPYEGQFFGTLEYLQLDYNANSHLTITAGRFLTPFGLFTERLSPIWITKFQDAPIITPIGTGGAYNNGFMLRGALVSNSSYVINYAAYFSALSTVENLGSQRGAGGRVGLFLPGTRLEIGTSYRRTLQDRHLNSFGMDFSWSPYRVPLALKSEWGHSPSGYGYWIQAAYRLSQLGGENSALGRLEPVFRMQQFVRSEAIAGDSLPSVDAQRPEFGLNYYLPYEVRLNASYGRALFSQSTDANIWEFGITYRFLFPLWPGGSK